MARSAREILQALRAEKDGNILLGDRRLTPGLTDPTEFGNWVTVDKRTLGAGTTKLFDAVPGEYKIEVSTITKVATGDVLFIANNDTTASYYTRSSWPSSSSSPVANTATMNGIPIVPPGFSTAVKRLSTVLMTVLPGSISCTTVTRTAATAAAEISGSISTISIGTGKEVVADFIQAVIAAGIEIEVEVYRWQEIKPVELHSYELVKEYNLVDEVLFDEIEVDGELHNHMYVEADCGARPGGATVYVALNDDLSSSNYSLYQITNSDGANLYQSKTTSKGLVVGKEHIGPRSLNSIIRLKSGFVRSVDSLSLIHI